MNDLEAKEHLKKNLTLKGEILDKERLYSVGWYLAAHINGNEATLDGKFDADDLEAIARWMRDPAKVMYS